MHSQVLLTRQGHFAFFHLKFYFVELASNYKEKKMLLCADAMHLFSRKGKKNSEIVLSGMWAYGAVCQITVLVIYIMICTGMRNQDGKQFLLKLLRMIIHRIEINLDLCLLKH